MQIVKRFVLARLRNRRFFSLDEINAAIRERVTDLNARIMRKLGASRDELLIEIEKPASPAADAVSVCRVEEMSGNARLSRRDRHYYSVQASVRTPSSRIST
ncbi:hypothetical protein [Bradyrhizobium sp. CCBAU 51745]|uniref:hypothetical protein n=1 Tax=Bradyrhizobium sp. CCBAU 51745 TaxID=1325099 RepID=UPI002306B10C|nr:hypothetical protein [Bradyrhizobium sp. CCBAU 51745]